MTEPKKTDGLTKIADLIAHSQEGIETTIDVVKELGEDGDPIGHRLIVERRTLQQEPPVPPARTEAKRRAHEFYAVAGFTSYLNKFGGGVAGDTKDPGIEYGCTTVILADFERRKIQAILDDDPGETAGGREVLSFTPQVHPRWSPWRELLGQKITLDDFADFVRLHRRSIVPGQGNVDGRGLAFLLGQVTASTEVRLHQGKGSGALNGLTIQTTISGGGPQTDNVPLPESITVRAPIFVDSTAEQIEIDLVLTAKRDGSEVYVQLASGDLYDAEVSAFEAIVDRLRTEFDGKDGYVVAHGSVHEEDWDYLR